MGFNLHVPPDFAIQSELAFQLPFWPDKVEEPKVYFLIIFGIPELVCDGDRVIAQVTVIANPPKQFQTVFLRFLNLLIRERDRACVCKQGEGQRERKSQVDSALNPEPNVGLDLRALRYDLSRNHVGHLTH